MSLVEAFAYSILCCFKMLSRIGRFLERSMDVFPSKGINSSVLFSSSAYPGSDVKKQTIMKKQFITNQGFTGLPVLISDKQWSLILL